MTYLDPAGLPDALVLLVDVLALYRLTRLVTRDEILRPARERLLDVAETRRWARGAYLLECPWCVSPWLAAGVLLARSSAPLPWHLLALVLALSAVAGVLSERE